MTSLPFAPAGRGRRWSEGPDEGRSSRKARPLTRRWRATLSPVCGGEGQQCTYGFANAFASTVGFISTLSSLISATCVPFWVMTERTGRLMPPNGFQSE